MFLDKIISLTKQLYPKGRAFKMPKGSFFESVHTAMARIERDAYEDALSTLDSILPDNDNFTEDDATAWERRLGLINGSGIELADRKLSIRRKMNFPGEQPARQHWTFLQSQLQAAGFEVYVYENPDNLGPEDVLFFEGLLGDGQLSDYQLGDPTTQYDYLFKELELGDVQLGDNQLGGKEFRNKVVSHIDGTLDDDFIIGSSYRACFYVGGTPFGTVATVPEERKNEFRELILRIKPVQTVGLLLIRYT